jgi:hypothetical protein
MSSALLDLILELLEQRIPEGADYTLKHVLAFIV